jgi:hypothetical protein
MSRATASREGDTVWDAKGSEDVGLKVANGVTTYWKGQPLKRKAQSEQGEEQRPAKKQKKSQKKQHRRFTAPVAESVREPETYEYDEGLQTYLKALEKEEVKAKAKSLQSDPMLPEDSDIDMERPKSPRPQSLEISPTAAAALASTSGMLSNRSGAATPPHSSEPTLSDQLFMPQPQRPHLSQRMLSDRLLMPPPPLPIPQYRPPQAPIPSVILAWKIDPSYRCLSYLVSSQNSSASPL